MKAGESIFIQATVLRVDGDRVDAQTGNGQLIQTDKSNVVEHKAVLNSPENKAQVQRRKNRISGSSSNTTFEQ